MFRVWSKFFRVRNLVTVPGDVLVGAMAVFALGPDCSDRDPVRLAAAVVAGVVLYMFGLADNDIVGVKTDPPDRPLASGELSMTAARIARWVCLIAVLLIGYLAELPVLWRFMAIFATLSAIIVYNRTKWCLVMGLCRGFNVLCGAAAVLVPSADGAHHSGFCAALVAAAVWTLYIAGVTKFSERETFDPDNQRKVALLVYGLMGLQVAAIAVLFII